MGTGNLWITSMSCTAVFTAGLWVLGGLTFSYWILWVSSSGLSSFGHLSLGFGLSSSLSLLEGCKWDFVLWVLKLSFSLESWFLGFVGAQGLSSCSLGLEGYSLGRLVSMSLLSLWVSGLGCNRLWSLG